MYIHEGAHIIVCSKTFIHENSNLVVSMHE